MPKASRVRSMTNRHCIIVELRTLCKHAPLRPIDAKAITQTPLESIYT